MSTRLKVFCLIVIVLSVSMVSVAQLELEVSTDPMLTQANNFIPMLIPIFGISIGIGIAVAVLSLLGLLITRALSMANYKVQRGKAIRRSSGMSGGLKDTFNFDE